MDMRKVEKRVVICLKDSLTIEFDNAHMMFKILRDWDPLRIILSIWTLKSHVGLINTRLYFRRVVPIKNESMLSWGIDSFRLSRPKRGHYVSQSRLSRPRYIKNTIFAAIIYMPIQVEST